MVDFQHIELARSGGCSDLGQRPRPAHGDARRLVRAGRIEFDRAAARRCPPRPSAASVDQPFLEAGGGELAASCRRNRRGRSRLPRCGSCRRFTPSTIAAITACAARRPLGMPRLPSGWHRLRAPLAAGDRAELRDRMRGEIEAEILALLAPSARPCVHGSASARRSAGAAWSSPAEQRRLPAGALRSALDRRPPAAVSASAMNRRAVGHRAPSNAPAAARPSSWRRFIMRRSAPGWKSLRGWRTSPFASRSATSASIAFSPTLRMPASA